MGSILPNGQNWDFSKNMFFVAEIIFFSVARSEPGEGWGGGGRSWLLYKGLLETDNFVFVSYILKVFISLHYSAQQFKMSLEYV